MLTKGIVTVHRITSSGVEVPIIWMDDQDHDLVDHVSSGLGKVRRRQKSL